MNNNCIGLIEILGKENADKVRSAITDALIDNIKDSLDEYYVMSNETLNNELDEMVKECFDTVKEKYMDAMEEAIEQKFKDCLEKLNRE